MEELRIACRRNPRDLWVVVPSFRPIGSEERLSIGAGQEVVALVAHLEARPQGVEATGEVSAAFLRALAAGAPVSVSYGAQTLGEAAGPPKDMAERFARACNA